ncbi:MAG: PHP domain-containing protein [Coprococcus sp.]
MNRVRFDMHCHTAEGSPDAKVKILDYIDLLKQRGFHGMLVTDHDSYSDTKRTWAEDKVKDLLLRGIEYDTFDYGHFLIVLPSDTPEEVYDLFEHRDGAYQVIWLVHELAVYLAQLIHLARSS